MDRPSISYATRSDGTQQAELATLANVNSFVIKKVSDSPGAVVSTCSSRRPDEGVKSHDSK